MSRVGLADRLKNANLPSPPNDSFNHRRLLEPIGNIPPTEAEVRYYATIELTAMAARLKPNSLRQTRRGSGPD